MQPNQGIVKQPGRGVREKDDRAQRQHDEGLFFDGRRQVELPDQRVRVASPFPHIREEARRDRRGDEWLFHLAHEGEAKDVAAGVELDNDENTQPYQ